MSYFDDVYDRLFRKSNSNQAEFLVDEIIYRSKTFDQKFKAFGLASLYNSKEIINGISAVKKECLNLKTV